MPSGGGGQTAFGGQGQSGYGGNSWGMGPQQGQSKPQAQPQPTGDVSSLYTSLLGRAPDPAGQAYWQHLADTGTSMQDIGQGMYATPEGQARAATDYVPMNRRPGFQPQMSQQGSMYSPSSQPGNMYGGAGWGGGLGQLLSSMFGGGGNNWSMFNQPMSFPQQGSIFRPSVNSNPAPAQTLPNDQFGAGV